MLFEVKNNIVCFYCEMTMLPNFKQHTKTQTVRALDSQGYIVELDKSQSKRTFFRNISSFDTPYANLQGANSYFEFGEKN